MVRCSDSEGWDTVSRIRPFDLTLCFEEGILLSSLFAVLSVGSLVYSLYSCTSPSKLLASKSKWLLFAKLVRHMFIIYVFILIRMDFFTVSLMRCSHIKSSKLGSNRLPGELCCSLSVLHSRMHSAIYSCNLDILQPHEKATFIPPSSLVLATVCCCIRSLDTHRQNHRSSVIPTSFDS
jgi:hypothetical protein